MAASGRMQYDYKQTNKHKQYPLNHHSPAIAVFHPSTRPRLMQADAGFSNHVQAGQLLTQAGPAGR
jgi:hypothetical protein